MGKGGGSAATSNNVYVMDKELAWVPARLIELKGDSAVVSIPTYEDQGSIANDGGKKAKSWREETIKLKNYPGKTLPMANCDKAGCLVEKEDMVDLPFLHEVRS
jgi:hypothetical protein